MSECKGCSGTCCTGEGSEPCVCEAPAAVSPLLSQLRKRFPGETITEKMAEAAQKIGNANGLTPGLVMTVLLASEKEGWEYVGW